MRTKAKLEHLVCPKVGGTNPLVPPTFESAGAQAPAVPPSPTPLLWCYISLESFFLSLQCKIYHQSLLLLYRITLIWHHLKWKGHLILAKPIRTWNNSIFLWIYFHKYKFIFQSHASKSILIWFITYPKTSVNYEEIVAIDLMFTKLNNDMKNFP